jgi:hypothetical protein
MVAKSMAKIVSLWQARLGTMPKGKRVPLLLAFFLEGGVIFGRNSCYNTLHWQKVR